MSAKQKDVGSSPAHDQEFFVQVFFGLMRLFSQFFLMCPKDPPFIFSYFAKEWMVKNSQRVPFYIFRHYATYRRPNKYFEKKFKKNRIFFQFFSHAGTVEENT